MATEQEQISTLEKTLKTKIRELIELHHSLKAPLGQVLMVEDELEQSYVLAIDLLAHGKDLAAAQLLGTMCIMQPYDGRYWRILGLALHKIKRANLALAAFEMALVIIPDDIPTLTYRGETHILLGRIVEARNDLQKVLDLGQKPSKDDLPFVQRAKGLIRYARPQTTTAP